RYQMAPDQHFITIKGTRSELGLFIFPQPRMEPFPQRELVRCHKRALLLVSERFGELIGDLLPRLAIEGGTLGLSSCWIPANRDWRHPAPIGAPGDTAFVVSPFLSHRVVSPRSSVLRHTRARTVSLVCLWLLRLYLLFCLQAPYNLYGALPIHAQTY